LYSDRVTRNHDDGGGVSGVCMCVWQKKNFFFVDDCGVMVFGKNRKCKCSLKSQPASQQASQHD